MITYITSSIIPIIILITIIYGIRSKQDVLKLFTEGVAQGLKTVYKIFPYILAVMIAITLLKETSTINYIIKPIKPLLEKMGVPETIIPLAVFRPISGGGSISILMDIFKDYGPDSLEGKIASLIMGGTETTFYVITVTFGAARIRKKRGVLIAAILADIAAIIASIVIVKLCWI